MLTNADVFLIICSFFTSVISAALGVGGGALLIVIMASFYPPSILIPVHGMVQFGSNFGRALLMLKHICWQTSLVYIFGTVVGVAIGSQVFINLSERLLGFILAIAILFFTWYPQKEANKQIKGTSFLVGIISGFLTLFVGATGLLTASFLSRNKKASKYNKVATFAICMTAQHLFKVVAFFMLGFIFAPYVLLITLMIISGIVGTWVGKQHLLDRLDEEKFSKIFKLVVTLLAVKLIIGLFI